jgi:hypothetical protein
MVTPPIPNPSHPSGAYAHTTKSTSRREGNKKPLPLARNECMGAGVWGGWCNIEHSFYSNQYQTTSLALKSPQTIKTTTNLAPTLNTSLVHPAQIDP